MPVRGDLGFPYLVLVVLIFCSAIGLVVRRKWRLSVTRSEEIKRLVVLASEEAARAELEASIGYVTSPVATISRPLQYQCAVCFCPTTTRCARCKAVRYCSGKCQIIHWRQGHKEECRPFTTSYQNDDKGGASCQKVLKQEEYEINGNSFETVGRQSAESVQNFSEKPASSKSDCSPEVLRLNDDSEVECLADLKGEKSSSHESKRLDGHLSTNILSDKIKTNCVSNVERDVTDSDTHCASTSSSGWTVDGSNESSFSQPSSPSSDFWEGTIDSSRSKIDALHYSAQTSSSDAGDANMQNSQSSLSSSSNRNAVPHVDVWGSGTKTVISDDAHSTSRGIKGSIGRADLSVKTCEDASKGRNPDHMDVYCTSYSSVSGSREPVYCSSSAYASPTSSAGRPAISTHASKVGIMRSMSPERSNLVVNDKINTSHPLDSKGGGSLSSGASVAHLSTTTRSHSQGANPGKVDNAHANVTTSEHANYSPNAKTGLKTSMQKVVDQLRVSKSSRHSQSGVGSEIAGRYNNKGLFPYELFVKLYNWNKIELRPCGLTNCGNSCYANAVLQCLTCTPPLTAYLLQGLHSRACKTKEWCFTCEFESLILKAKEGTSPLSPIGILSQIQNIGSHLGNGREEDAHEFLRYAVDTMHSVCLKEAGVYASGSVTEETTLIGLTFGGYLRSKIKCMKCGGKSERHERMMDLTVEIEGDIGTLEEALRQFTGTEILDGENKYQCSRCRSYERAKKKMTVLEAPNILTIALKRFQSGKFGKLNKPIQFPEILDLAPYMSGTSDKSPIYRLYGVVVHLDVLNAAFSGHYVCYVKNVQNKWFKIDDSTVKAVDLESVLTKRAYLLLYARCSPRAPRLIRNSIISLDPRKPKNSIFKSRSHSTSPWDTAGADPSSGHADIGCLYPNHSGFQPIRRILEDDSSSDHSSSIFSSEECSTSTDSSNRDSTSADDYFDHFFGDSLQNWNSNWLKNSSDSDSSSSSSSPSPLFSRHSPLADSDRYSSGYPETSGFQSQNAESDMDNNGFWARQPSSRSGNWEGKVNVPILYCDTTKQCIKLVSSSSCRETDSGRLGWANSFDYNKSGLSLRRSTREQTD